MSAQTDSDRPPARRPSLLMWSAAQRLAASALLVLALWLAVAWALDG